MKPDKFLYDLLYDQADTLFKVWNPCKIKDGVCAEDRACKRMNRCCCGGCKYITSIGCLVRALYCKTWMCYYLQGRYPYLALQLEELHHANIKLVHSYARTVYEDTERSSNDMS